jgi:hypothetical protein
MSLARKARTTIVNSHRLRQLQRGHQGCQPTRRQQSGRGRQEQPRREDLGPTRQREDRGLPELQQQGGQDQQKRFQRLKSRDQLLLLLLLRRRRREGLTQCVSVIIILSHFRYLHHLDPLLRGQ